MRLGLTPGAESDLYELEKALHLPSDTRPRWIECLKLLETFPSAGRALEGELSSYRVWRGPWRWMLSVYEVLPDEDLVAVVAVHDARSSTAPS